IARFGGPDLTLTMLTGTLAALAANLPFTGGSGNRSVRSLAATLALFSGALVGALALKTSLWLPLTAAAGLALVAWLIYVPAIQRHRRARATSRTRVESPLRRRRPARAHSCDDPPERTT